MGQRIRRVSAANSTMSAADAAFLVRELESGAVTVNDLLGRLYNQGKSPEISIPRGGTTPAVVAPEVKILQ